MNINHVKPVAWRGGEVLNNETYSHEHLENILLHIATNERTSKSLASNLRRDIHYELESGSGVVLHKSQFLARLDRTKFKSVFETFCS